MVKLGSREFFALLVLSVFVLSAVSANAAGSANFLKQKNAEKYFAKASRETIPSGYIPAYKTAKEELEALRKQK